MGDIGITSSFVDQSKQDEQSGLTYNQLSIGTYKDMFSPDKPLSDAEKRLVMEQLQVYYQKLLDEVATNRHLDPATVQSLSDGRSFTGSEALENKLIDGVGGIDEVLSYVSEKLGNDAVICGIDE